MINRLDKLEFFIAIALSALAGLVDATGFLELGGYFVSFMSGNSTQLAVNLTLGNAPKAMTLSLILFLFVTGAALGTLMRHAPVKWSPTVTVLAFVSTLLLCAATLGMLEHKFISAMCMTIAMGAVNASIQKEDNLVGLTYMTGTLVKVGQHIAQAILGKGSKLAWFPYLCFWTGLVTGGATGVLLYDAIGLNSLWIASAGAVILTALMAYHGLRSAR